MASGKAKGELIPELISEFRIACNQDSAFDNVAAEVLGLNRTDLHCINIIENSGGLTAGELAAQAGLTTGAVTGVIDRLERVGFANRISDPDDRRRVKLAVTQDWYARANQIWGPIAADWTADLSDRFTAEQLDWALRFLQATNELSRKHLQRLRELD